MIRARLALGAVLASGALAACTITTTPDDAGTTTTATTETVEYQCTAIGTAVCQALPMCAIPMSSTLSDCISSYVATCCTSATCSEVAESSDSVLQACIAAYQQPLLDCNALTTSVVPAACTDVPQIP
jgi:hypothetical protein